jgi:hypothetical protein
MSLNREIKMRLSPEMHEALTSTAGSVHLSTHAREIIHRFLIEHDDRYRHQVTRLREDPPNYKSKTSTDSK